MTMPYKIPAAIEEYMLQVESGAIESCKEQKLLCKHVRKAFAEEDIFVNEEQLGNYLGQAKYFPYDDIFTWEKFCLGLHCCTYWADGLPRWPDLFMLIGRGAGKDGYIAFESWCLVSPYNGIRAYDIDICANSELQAKAPFVDIWNVLEDPKHTAKLKKHFYWNREDITNLKTKAIIKYRTNNPKGKDGLRSGMVVFNEIHQYEDFGNINVFTTGLGKKRHPRRLYATTDGKVRDGPLDQYKERSIAILEGGMPDNGWLPFICRLDSKEEIHNPEMWEKANPSLPYLPALREEIAKEYEEWKESPAQCTDFPTKRMNSPDGNADVQVTEWENIKATNRPTEIKHGMRCVVGIDYASISDFASVEAVFRIGQNRHRIGHSWLCLKSKDIPRMKCPWREWEKAGLLTVVDDVEINPDLITAWIEEFAKSYHIAKLALDNYRYALISASLRKIGFDAKEAKNVFLLHKTDQMKVSPIIESCFNKKLFVFGDDPVLRWATNNTKMIRNGINKDTGNMSYGKIEPKSRKTDPFMALVAAMCIEGELGDGSEPSDTMRDLGVWTF